MDGEDADVDEWGSVDADVDDTGADETPADGTGVDGTGADHAGSDDGEPVDIETEGDESDRRLDG